jgi:hypothetical protein
LDRLLVGCCALHPNEEMVLVLDEEDDDTLVEPILLWRHGVVGVRQHARLEDGGQVLRRHAVLIRLGRKDG